MREWLWYGSAVAIGALAAILWGRIRDRKREANDPQRPLTREEYERELERRSNSERTP